MDLPLNETLYRCFCYGQAALTLALALIPTLTLTLTLSVTPTLTRTPTLTLTLAPTLAPALYGQAKAAERLRVDFRVPDRRGSPIYIYIYCA